MGWVNRIGETSENNRIEKGQEKSIILEGLERSAVLHCLLERISVSWPARL